MSEQHPVGIREVRTVGITVRDQDQALTFYTGTLGLDLRVDAPFGDGGRWIEVAPPDAVTSVTLLLHRDDQPIGVDTAIRLTITDADTAHASLSAAGVDVDPEVLRWPGVPPMFSLRDPDGNVVYLVEPEAR